jgi:hypothetical protein
MSRTKRLCLLAATAVIAAALFGGASSASASSLCTTNSSQCASTYPQGTTISASLQAGTSFKLTGALVVTCTSSEIKAKTTSSAGQPLTAEMTQLTLGGCGSTCAAVEATNLPYSSNFEATGGGNGTVTVQSKGSGDPTIKTTNCVFGITCSFKSSKVSLGFTGGSPGTLTAKNVPLQDSGCGNDTLNATYTINSPSPLFLSTTALAKVCQTGSGTCTPYAGGTVVSAQSGEVVLQMLGLTTNCKSSTLEGKVNGSGEMSEVTGFALNLCSIGCESIKAEGLPWKTHSASPGGLAATMYVESPQVRFTNCTGLGYNCTMTAAVIEMDVNSAFGVPVIKAINEPLSFGLCGSGSISAEYTVSKPSPAYFRAA